MLFRSSSKVLQALDPKLVASKIKVDFSETINERSLGVHWHVNEDSFFYTVQQPPRSIPDAKCCQ